MFSLNNDTYKTPSGLDADLTQNTGGTWTSAVVGLIVTVVTKMHLALPASVLRVARVVASRIRGVRV